MSDIKQVFSKRINQNKSIESFVDQHTIAQGEIFKAIKDKDYRAALNKSLAIMPLGVKIKWVCEILYRGKYRAYSLGIKRFKKEIDSFLINRDKKAIQTFHDIMIKEQTSSVQDNGFYAARTNILSAILDEKYPLAETVEHLLHIGPYSDIDDIEVAETQRQYKTLLLELCGILYPENQAFKVLFV